MNKKLENSINKKQLKIAKIEEQQRVLMEEKKKVEEELKPLLALKAEQEKIQKQQDEFNNKVNNLC